ncbi:MAG: HPr-rel-A system PqqD family peptide chaperone [Anaeromyxobacter sp.]|nr:HPr-rel-A system PqqD family peptide chaperone [Anaeromyxobacter sp.]MBL0278343.1 HPr-rel-A system PqqD family peptide chaperone [Anaeromyxobacter sp.]
MTDRTQRLKDLAVSESGFLFDPYTGLTFSLNQTGRFILERLRGGLTEPAIRQALEAGYQTGPGDDPLRDVREFLEQLRESGLLPAEERP